MGTLENIYVFNIGAESTVNVADDLTANGYNAGDITFKSWEMVYGGDIAELLTTEGAEEVPVTVAIDGAAFVDNVTAVESGSVGADVSAFDWTFTKSLNVF